MKLFVTAKFKGDENKPDIEKICSLVRSAGLTIFALSGMWRNINEEFSQTLMSL